MSNIYVMAMIEKLVNSEANYNRIKNVEECFGSMGKPLLIPGRVLVGEGILHKMCRKGLKQRIFFLFSDILVYGNILIKKRMYNKQRIIRLEEIKVESFESSADNGWFIKTKCKSFLVYSATAQEKQEWMSYIKRCTESLVYKDGKKIPESFAAVWVPDMEADICMCCKKTEFTVIVRRHHCRCCGNVVCRPCSSNTFLLPNHEKAERVCQNCYVKLIKPELQIDLQNHSLRVVPLHKVQTISLESLSDDPGHEDESNNKHNESISHSLEDKRQSVFYGCSSEDISGVNFPSRSTVTI